MPIPESASFLAKKPTVPPTFDNVDLEDTTAVKKAQDAIIREQWVRSMMARLVREELGKCYRREGVNHLEKCGALREKYFELLPEAKIRGYKFEQQNYLDERAKASANGLNGNGNPRSGGRGSSGANSAEQSGYPTAS